MSFTAVFVLSTTVVFATSDPARRSDPPVRPATGKSVVATRAVRATSVMGSAWTMNDTPIPAARLQLRNLVTAKIVATTIADNAGRFTFTNIESGTYAVELVGNDGKVLTVGHTFVIGQGETIATFVRLATRVPWYAGFFSNAATAVAAVAASQGIGALAPVQLPLSSSR